MMTIQSIACVHVITYVKCIHFIKALVITNGPMDTAACIGSIAIISCGFDNVSNLFVPSWRIIKRSDDGSVIGDVTLNVIDINNDDNDGLQYIPDTTSGMDTSPNSRLLVGPVDETDNQSSYQCIFNIGNDVFESSVGTLTVTGMSYASGSINFNVDTCILYVTKHDYMYVRSCCMYIAAVKIM